MEERKPVSQSRIEENQACLSYRSSVIIHVISVFGDGFFQKEGTIALSDESSRWGLPSPSPIAMFGQSWGYMLGQLELAMLELMNILFASYWHPQQGCLRVS